MVLYAGASHVTAVEQGYLILHAGLHTMMALHAGASHVTAVEQRYLVLHIGLHTMMALHAGASHVTAVERWLYLSLACKQTLQANGFHADAYKVIYKRPTDLALQHDVPNFCNLLLCDILDEGKHGLLVYQHAAAAAAAGY